MNWQELNKEFSKLQKAHGASDLDSIMSGGCFENPDICFVFMNPTSRNVSASKNWTSIKAPWLGTKHVWGIFHQLGYLDDQLYATIKQLKPQEWDYHFAEKLYEHIAEQNIYITNLAKCTQIDARPLKNPIFKAYLPLFLEEIKIINPKVVITFGNQVSTIILNKTISVSKQRGESFDLEYSNKTYTVFPTYYPVGQGQRNLPLAIEDIQKIKDSI